MEYTGVADLCNELHRRRDWANLTREHRELVLRIVEHHAAWEAQLYDSTPEMTPLPANIPMPSGAKLERPK